MGIVSSLLGSRMSANPTILMAEEEARAMILLGRASKGIRPSFASEKRDTPK
jgi:hypothetical protein